MLVFALLALLAIAWTVLYLVVIQRRLRQFRYTAGIYARLDAAEADLWARLLLWLKGLKVLIAGVVTSAVPLVPVMYDKVSGVDWTAIVPSEKAKLIALVVAAAGIAGPMIMAVLHSAGLADAAAIEPKA